MLIDPFFCEVKIEEFIVSCSYFSRDGVIQYLKCTLLRKKPFYKESWVVNYGAKLLLSRNCSGFFPRNLILPQISQFSSVESHFQLNLSSSPKHQIFVAIFMAQAIIFRLIFCLSWLPGNTGNWGMAWHRIAYTHQNEIRQPSSV